MLIACALVACGGGPVPHRPMGDRTLRRHAPVPAAPGVTAVQPVAEGTGRAPVRGIEFREVYLDSIRGRARPFEMDVRSWSEYFRDALVRELGRAGVATTTGPILHVEVRSLDVDSPFALGATTCRLEAHVVVRDAVAARVHPVTAEGRADKSHTCIGNAFAALVRHIVGAPWLATAPPAPVGIERARPLPNTAGRYGLQLGGQAGVGAVRTRGTRTSTELATAYGIVLDLGIRQDLFFTGSVHGESGVSAAIGVGFSYYLDHSILISASFLAGGGSAKTEVEVPALGGQLLLGKQWQVSPSVWFGVVARPFALWSLADGRAYGAALLGTFTLN